jgi:hypothetical protein
VAEGIITAAAAANLITVRTTDSTSAASFAAIAYPIRALNTDIAVGAVRLVSDTVGTFAAFITNPVTAGAFFAAVRADGFAHFITSAAFFLTFAMILKAISAVVTQFVIVITRAAITAVMFFIAGSTRTFAAMVTAVAFPVIITPCTAVVTLHAVFIRRGNRKRE